MYLIIIIIILLIFSFINFVNFKENFKNTQFSLKNLIINYKKMLFFPDIGLTEFKIPIYTIFNSDMAKIYFRILNHTSLEYYVFAGSSIGMVRNGKNIPWVDDYDIIIFKDQLDTYKNKVIPLLEKHGITTHLKYNNNNLLVSKAHIFDFSISEFEIFTSYVNSHGHVKCLRNSWGRYNTKGITINMIKPAKYLEFDNMGFKIPFFNHLKEDVKKEYGNVIDYVDIHINHKTNNMINSHYSKVYKEFDNIVNNAINNTKRVIQNSGDVHKYLHPLIIKNKNKFTDRINLLQYIYKNDIGKIYILSNDFLKFTYTIKYYFPHIQIILYIYKEIKEITPIMLNKVDIVRVLNYSLIKKYTKDIFYINKPKFEHINLKHLNYFIKVT